jgi:hypothetical protein
MEDDLRGRDMVLVVNHALLGHAKTGGLTPGEARMKQAVWEWFAALSPLALERVRVVWLWLCVVVCVGEV